MVEQAAGDLEPPLHAAREGPHDVAGFVGQVHHRQQFARTGPKHVTRHVVEHRVEPQVFAPGQPVVEARVLEDDADRLAHPVRLTDDVESVDGRGRTRRVDRALNAFSDRHENPADVGIGAMHHRLDQRRVDE